MEKLHVHKSCLTGCTVVTNPITVPGPEKYEAKRKDFLNLYGIDINHIIRLIANHPTANGDIIFPKTITWESKLSDLCEVNNFKKFHNLSTLACLQTSMGVDEDQNVITPRCVLSSTSLLDTYTDEDIDKIKSLIYIEYAFGLDILNLTHLIILPLSDKDYAKARRKAEEKLRKVRSDRLVARIGIDW